MKNKARIVILDQWVEVEIRAGQTVTTLYPPNAELLKRKADMQPPPAMVYRRINFPTRVPKEYGWTTDDPTRRQFGGHCIQRMTLQTWLLTIGREAAQRHGHIGPCGAIMPRPASSGGCDCPACQEAASRLDVSEWTPEPSR